MSDQPAASAPPDASSPYPPTVARLLALFGQLPGVGPRSAERMVNHVLSAPRPFVMEFAATLEEVKTRVTACPVCFFISEDGACGFCRDPRRDASRICVVEMPRDVIAVEKTGAWNGLYHALQGRLSPSTGVDVARLRLGELAERIRGAETPVVEVALALSPTAEGDLTSTVTAEALAGFDLAVTRLARGLSGGVELEHVAASALRMAVAGRTELSRQAPSSASGGSE